MIFLSSGGNFRDLSSEIMMDIDDGDEISRERLFDNPIHPVKERFINCIGRLIQGMSGPSDRDSYGIKSRLLDQVKITFLKAHAPVTFLGRFEGIAQVHSPSDLRVPEKGILGAGRFVFILPAERNVCQNKKNEQDYPHFPTPGYEVG